MPAKRIRLLTVSFDTTIQNYEIPAFRGAIIQKVGLDNELFHNHVNNTGVLPDTATLPRFHFRYPLIQYKTIRQRPTIQCIEQGVDEIYRLFAQNNWLINLSGRTLDMRVEDLRLNPHTLQIDSRLYHYSLRNWIALNADNFRIFQTLDRYRDRIDLLERILTANILAFGRGVDWSIEDSISVQITDAPNTKHVKLKGIQVLAFDLQFSSNVLLPNYIGLGKSASIGYGVVHRLHNNSDTGTYVER